MVSAYLCNMEEVLGSAQLPALPHSAIHLLELTKNEDNGPAEYALPIEADPRLAGQILKFINSTYFGFANEVTSIQLGINLVGIRSIKNFALWTAVFSLIPSMQVGRFDIRLLWQDSLRRARFAQAMSKYQNVAVPNEDLFTAALLQDLAIPILMREFPNEYPKMFEYRVEEGGSLSEIEKEIFGWNHASAGSFVARSWKLPETLCRHIENHTKIDPRWSLSNALVGQFIVSLSALLPDSFSKKWHEREAFCQSFDRINRPRRPLDEFFSLVDKEMEQFAPLLKLNTPGRSLALYLED